MGGLRGALTLVLALAVTEDDAIPAPVQRFVAVLATGFVLFTLFVNGTTLRLVIALLGLDRLSPRDAALRDHVLELSYIETRDAAAEIARTHALPQATVARVTAPYDARIAAFRPAEAAAALTERDRLAIALVALANQERVLALAMLADRLAAPAAVQLLLGDADALAEAARSEGRLGYQRAGRQALVPPAAFGAAAFLDRRLGFGRFFAARLGDRVEHLLATGVITRRLVRFNAQQVASLFGDRIAAITGRIIERRRAMIAEAGETLRRHYPDYVAELETRFLRQSTLRHEMTRYQSLFAEGLISAEVYEDLKRSALGAGAERRPRPAITPARDRP